MHCFSMIKNIWNEKVFSLEHFLKPYNHVLREFPFYVDIEPTNACNFDCLMCNRNIMDRKIGWMSIDTHNRIIDEVAKYNHLGVGVRYVRHGEPTLHPDIGEMLKYASSKNVLTCLSTNAFTLDNVADCILETGLDYLRISFQGVNAKSYDQMRDKDNTGKYLKVCRNIFDFMMKRNQKQLDRPYVSIGTSVTTESDKEKEIFKQFWGDIVDEVQIGITTFSRLEARSKEINEFVSTSGYSEEKIRFYQPCTEVLTKLSVNWSGDISACCSDVNGDLIIERDSGEKANIHNTSLKEAWLSNYLKDLRKLLGTALRHKEIYPCKECYRENLTNKFKKIAKNSSVAQVNEDLV